MDLDSICYDIHKIIAVSGNDWRDKLAGYLKMDTVPTGEFEYAPVLGLPETEIEMRLYTDGLHPILSHPVLLFLYRCNRLDLAHRLYHHDGGIDIFLIRISHGRGGNPNNYIEKSLSMFPIKQLQIATQSGKTLDTSSVIELFKGVGRVNPNPLQGTNYQLYALHALIDTDWYVELKRHMIEGTYAEKYLHYSQTIGMLADSMGSRHEKDLDERTRLIRESIEIKKDITDISLMDGHGRTISRISRIFQMGIAGRQLTINVFDIDYYNDLWHKNTMPLDQEGNFTAFGPREGANIFNVFDTPSFSKGKTMLYLNFSGLGTGPFIEGGSIYSLFTKLLPIQNSQPLLDNLMISFNIGPSAHPAVNNAGISTVLMLHSPKSFGMSAMAPAETNLPDTENLRTLLQGWSSDYNFVVLTERGVNVSRGKYNPINNMGDFVTMGLNGGTFSELRSQILLLRRPWMGSESQIKEQIKWGQRFKDRFKGQSLKHGIRMKTLSQLYGGPATGTPETGPNEGMGGPTGKTKSDSRYRPYGGGSKQKRRKKSRKSRKNTLKKRPRKTFRKTLKKRSKRSKRSTKRH